MSMKKNALFTVSLLSVFISLSCYAHQDVILHSDSLSDAKVSINDDTWKTQIEVINTNQDGTAHIYYDRLDVGDFGLSLKNNAEAELIINEVVSKKLSILRGELELQGKKATVVIANPNGIICHDCSFSGIDDIKLITGSSTGKFSKKFTITDASASFSFSNEEPRNKFMNLKHVYKDISSEKINIISNRVILNEGDLNAKYIHFDIGLSEFTIGAKNNYNTIGNFIIDKEAGINSRYLLIKATHGRVENSGNIRTLTLDNESYYLFNYGNIDINTGDNLYRTADDDYKSSKIIVLTRYVGSNKSSFNIKDSNLLMKATYAYLDKKINLDNSYFTVDVERISIGNVKLSDNSNFFILSDKNISLRGKIRGYGHVILELNDDYMDIKNKKMLIGTDKSKLEGGTKYKLGRSTIIDYTEYK